ncbi:unnamed protein product [Amoebophrya sp. A120]|nr:unnamed protein product [Amoebophrya sp. A120]|eukprot:GSA120T00015914001.1
MKFFTRRRSTVARVAALPLALSTLQLFHHLHQTAEAHSTTLVTNKLRRSSGSGRAALDSRKGDHGAALPKQNLLQMTKAAAAMVTSSRKTSRAIGDTTTEDDVAIDSVLGDGEDEQKNSNSTALVASFSTVTTRVSHKMWYTARQQKRLQTRMSESDDPNYDLSSGIDVTKIAEIIIHAAVAFSEVEDPVQYVIDKIQNATFGSLAAKAEWFVDEYQPLVFAMLKYAMGEDDPWVDWMIQMWDDIRGFLSALMGSALGEAIEGISMSDVFTKLPIDGLVTTTSSSSMLQTSRRANDSSLLLAANKTVQTVPHGLSPALEKLAGMELFKQDGFKNAWQALKPMLDNLMQSEVGQMFFSASVARIIEEVKNSVKSFLAMCHDLDFDAIVDKGKALIKHSVGKVADWLEDCTGLDLAHVEASFNNWAEEKMDEVGDWAEDAYDSASEAWEAAQGGWDSMYDYWTGSDDEGDEHGRRSAAFLQKRPHAVERQELDVLNRKTTTSTDGGASRPRGGRGSSKMSYLEMHAKRFERKLAKGEARSSGEAKLDATLHKIWREAHKKHQAFLQRPDPLKQLVEVEIENELDESNPWNGTAMEPLKKSKSTTTKTKRTMTQGQFLQLKQQTSIQKMVRKVVVAKTTTTAGKKKNKKTTVFSAEEADYEPLQLVDSNSLVTSITNKVNAMLTMLSPKMTKHLVTIAVRMFFMTIYSQLVQFTAQLVGDALSGLVGAVSPVSFIGSLLGPVINLAMMEVGRGLENLIMPMFEKALMPLMPEVLTGLVESMAGSLVGGDTLAMVDKLVGNEGRDELVAGTDEENQGTSSLLQEKQKFLPCCDGAEEAEDTKTYETGAEVEPLSEPEDAKTPRPNAPLVDEAELRSSMTAMIDAETGKLQQQLKAEGYENVPESPTIAGENEMQAKMVETMEKSLVSVSAEGTTATSAAFTELGGTKASKSRKKIQQEQQQKLATQLSNLHSKVQEKRRADANYEAESNMLIASVKSSFNYLKEHYIPSCPDDKKATATLVAQPLDLTSVDATSYPEWAEFQKYLKAAGAVQMEGSAKGLMKKVIDQVGSGLFELVMPILVSVPLVGNFVSTLKPAIHAAFHVLSGLIAKASDSLQEWLEKDGKALAEKLMNLFLERVPCLDVLQKMEDWLLQQEDMDTMTDAALKVADGSAAAAAGSFLQQMPMITASKMKSEDYSKPLLQSDRLLLKKSSAVQLPLIAAGEKNGADLALTNTDHDDDDFSADSVLTVKLLRKLDSDLAGNSFYQMKEHQAGNNNFTAVDWGSEYRSFLEVQAASKKSTTSNKQGRREQSKQEVAARVLLTKEHQQLQKQKIDFDMFKTAFESAKSQFGIDGLIKETDFNSIINSVIQFAKEHFTKALKWFLDTTMLGTMIQMFSKALGKAFVHGIQVSIPMLKHLQTMAKLGTAFGIEGAEQLSQVGDMIPTVASSIMPMLVQAYFFEKEAQHDLKMLVDKVLSPPAIDGVFNATEYVVESVKNSGAFKALTDSMDDAWESLETAVMGSIFPDHDMVTESTPTVAFELGDLKEETGVTACPAGYEALTDSDECIAAEKLLYPDLPKWSNVAVQNIRVINNKELPFGCLKTVPEGNFYGGTPDVWRLEFNREMEDAANLTPANLICVKSDSGA